MCEELSFVSMKFLLHLQVTAKSDKPSSGVALITALRLHACFRLILSLLSGFFMRHLHMMQAEIVARFLKSESGANLEAFLLWTRLHNTRRDFRLYEMKSR